MSGSVRSFASAYTGHAGVSPTLSARARSRDRLRLLAEAIESEIVPRLIQGHESSRGAAGTPPAQDVRTRLQAWADSAQRAQDARASATAAAHDPAIDLHFAAIPQAAIDLAVLVLAEDDAGPRQAVADAVARDGLESVCLDLLAPAARQLGELWNEDICSFTDVTIGLMRLQSALLAVTVPVAGVAGAASARRTALLAPAPGDQHSFGLTMVAGFLERAGWSVTQLHDGAPDSVEAALRGTWFGVLGISAGSAIKLASLRRMLPRLRAVSRNPDLGIMVGGPPCVANPGLARDIGADCTAADGPQTVKIAEALIAPRRTPRVATG
jgi:methanogenic corrinoid protein MtbC1